MTDSTVDPPHLPQAALQLGVIAHAFGSLLLQYVAQELLKAEIGQLLLHENEACAIAGAGAGAGAGTGKNEPDVDEDALPLAATASEVSHP